MNLRPYQSEDLEKLRAEMKAGAHLLLFEASCGYGKSLVIETIAHAYAGRGDDVLVLSNRTAVVDQLTGRARGSKHITVSTVQGIVRRLDKITTPKVILVDEAHMGGAAAQYLSVFQAFPDALVIGFTGTPTPELHEVLPVHIRGKDAAWLTANGFLSPIRYVCPSVVDFSGVSMRGSDYDKDQLIKAVEDRSLCGDAIQTYRDHCAGRPTLLFTINKRHALAVSAEFAAAGIQSRVLLGGDKDVAAKIDWIKNGGLLIAVDKVSAGFDLPDLHAIISLRPTKSPQLWVQQLGRVARTSPGKLAGWVYDHAGNTFRCGTLTEHRDWRNGGVVGDDKQTEDGERIGIRRCDECFGIYPAGPICPFCDHENGQDPRITKRAAVQMREQEAADIEAARQVAGLAARREQGRSQTLAELTEAFMRQGQRNRFKARGRAIHVLKARLKKAEDAGDQSTADAIRSELAA